MFFAKIFEKRIVAGIAIIDVRKIVIIIVVRIFGEMFVICEIANAAPVLDFWIRRRVTKETDIMIVLIEPRRIRNCSSSCLATVEPMTAA